MFYKYSQTYDTKFQNDNYFVSKGVFIFLLHAGNSPSHIFF